MSPASYPIALEGQVVLPSGIVQGADKGRESNQVIKVNDPVDVGVGSTMIRFLPWYSNAISCVDDGGLPVLSGPFSGCIMGKIGGKVYHVSTASADDSGATDCKARWEKEKSSSSFDEFVPSRHCNSAKIIEMIGDNPGNWGVWGLFMPDGSKAALLMERVSFEHPIMVPGGKTTLKVRQFIPVRGE